MRNIIKDSPRSHMFAPGLYEMVVDRVEGQGQRLQIHQHTHNDVYSVYCMATGAKNERPETSAQEEYERHHAVQCWQRHFPS